jgi:hypothetical protein
VAAGVTGAVVVAGAAVGVTVVEGAAHAAISATDNAAVRTPLL